MEYLVQDVFTAGGIPTVTYVERDHGALSDEFRKYLNAGSRALTVHGPTKSGKTVLVNTILGTQAIVIDGGAIKTDDDLWAHLIFELDEFTGQSQAELAGNDEVTTIEASAEGGVLGVVKAKGGGSVATKKTTSISSLKSRSLPAKLVALDALQRSGATLVIDDFHYIPRDVRTDVIRALKAPIGRGVKVVLITVSHRALDPVLAETDMQGRICSVEIPVWSTSELKAIAANGFDVLNVECDSKLVEYLVENTFGSPHLMQAFCLQMCIENGVGDTQHSKKRIIQSSDRHAFFRRAVNDGGSHAFERLCLGPSTTGKPRKQRRRRSGGTSDIYEGMLEAIRLTGPQPQLDYATIRQHLLSVFDPADVPRKNEITTALKTMSDLARDEIGGEAVLDWRPELERLHVVDPFFMFHLKWHADFNRRCGGRTPRLR